MPFGKPMGRMWGNLRRVGHCRPVTHQVAQTPLLIRVSQEKKMDAGVKQRPRAGSLSITEQDTVQRKTYRNFCNIALEGRKQAIEDLGSDFCDGVKLCSLLEVLSGKSLQYNKQPKLHVHKLENLTRALDFLRKEGVGLVNIGPEDIASGNEHLTLALLWHIILHYQVKQQAQGGEGMPATVATKSEAQPEPGPEVASPLEPAREQTGEPGILLGGRVMQEALAKGITGEEVPAAATSGAASPTTAATAGIKEQMLGWINETVRPYGLHEIRNFTTDFQDGRVLSALADSLQKGSVDFQETDPLARTRAAMEAAKRYHDIPLLLEPEDVVSHPEPNSILAYCSYFKNRAAALEGQRGPKDAEELAEETVPLLQGDERKDSAGEQGAPQVELASEGAAVTEGSSAQGAQQEQQLERGQGKRVLLIAGDFTEGLEAYFALQAIRMLGHQVDTACPGKKAGEKIVTAVHDFEEGLLTYSEKRGYNFPITVDFEKLDGKDYDGLYLPGGRSPEYLRLNERVLDIIRHFNDNGKPIAALCHGPQLLVAAGVVKGRKVTSYAAVRPELDQAGASFVKVDSAQALTDGNLVTGVDWSGQGEVVREFAQLLGTKIMTA